jgi:hypothetical protein
MTMPVMPRGGKRPGVRRPEETPEARVFARDIEELADHIARIAEARGVGVSDIIREALEVYSRGRRSRPPGGETNRT